MNNEFKKIIKSAKGILLSTEEKQNIWKNVDFYVKENPVQKSHPQKSQQQRFLSIFSPYFIHSQRAVAFALVVVIAFGGGTTLLAQTALPNNALYSIKLATEDMRFWFVFSAQSKAYFDTARAGERLDEAKKLAVRGELDTTSKNIIQENFNKHVKSVQQQIARIEANNDLKMAIDVSKNLEESLKEHSASLTKVDRTQKSETKIKAKAKSLETDTVATPTPTEEITVATTVTSIESDIEEKDTAVISVSDDLTKTDVATSETVTAEETTSATNEKIANEKMLDSQTELSNLLDSVEANINTTAQVREEVEAKIPTLDDNEMKKATAQDKRKDAVTKIDKVKQSIDKNIEVSTTSIAIASSTLDKAVKFVDSGDTQFQVKEYGVAFTLYKNGLFNAVEAEKIISTTTPIINQKIIPKI